MFELHRNDVEVEALWGEVSDGIRSHAGPGLKGRLRQGTVEIKEELVAEATDGWGLAEGEAEAYGTFEIDLVGRGDMLVFEQDDKALATGVGPDVGFEEGAEIGAGLKGGLAVADPFKD